MDLACHNIMCLLFVATDSIEEPEAKRSRTSSFLHHAPTGNVTFSSNYCCLNVVRSHLLKQDLPFYPVTISENIYALLFVCLSVHLSSLCRACGFVHGNRDDYTVNNKIASTCNLHVTWISLKVGFTSKSSYIFLTLFTQAPRRTLFPVHLTVNVNVELLCTTQVF